MNNQEIQSLETFLNQLVQARGIAKDPQADSLIARAVAQQPDAAYLLVQRAMLVDRALDDAKAQIASLQNQLQSAQQQPSRGFLDAEPWGNAAGSGYRPGTGAAPAPAPAYGQPQAMQAQQAPAPSPGFFSGGMRGALGTAAATAAGVAGGAFLFQGIENMMHHGSGGSSSFMNPASAAAPATENTTVNNYYDSDRDTDTPTASSSDLDDLANTDMSFDDDSSFI